MHPWRAKYRTGYSPTPPITNRHVPNRTMADIIRVILSVIVPPIGVFFKVGFGKHFWINILLTMLGYVPGLVHAIWILASKD